MMEYLSSGQSSPCTTLLFSLLHDRMVDFVLYCTCYLPTKYWKRTSYNVLLLLLPACCKFGVVFFRRASYKCNHYFNVWNGKLVGEKALSSLDLNVEGALHRDYFPPFKKEQTVIIIIAFCRCISTAPGGWEPEKEERRQAGQRKE